MSEFPAELKSWLINEAQWVVPVLEHLRQDITLYSSLVIAAELKTAEDGDYFFEVSNPGGRLAWAWEREQAAAKELLGTGQLQICPTCADKVFYFGDGQKVSWPIMEMHVCEG